MHFFKARRISQNDFLLKNHQCIFETSSLSERMRTIISIDEEMRLTNNKNELS